jgi:hypothetical protein
MPEPDLSQVLEIHIWYHSLSQPVLWEKGRENVAEVFRPPLKEEMGEKKNGKLKLSDTF